jgi:branched-chain amino acid transport system ATP-binding protein
MLELAHVTAGYGSNVVLRDVSLVVPDRAVVALLGPNGAGKTTLLRVASGLLRPRSGQVFIDGADVTGWPPHRIAEAGVCHVPEGRGIFPALSVRDNLRIQTPKTAENDAIERVAKRFPRLGERLAQRAGTMSGGEQQMLALSRTSVTRATVALLDEVSMGLAPKIIDEIYAYLHELAARGNALLLVEQYVSRALDLADYVYVLNKGRISFAGEPAELGSEKILSSYLGV